MNPRPAARRWRRAALLAALLACCLRALNPPGAMLAFSDGVPGWVPCVADAMPMAAGGPAAPHQHHAGHHAGTDGVGHAGDIAGMAGTHAGHATTVCPFAVAHAAGLQAPPLAVLDPVWLPLQGGVFLVHGQVPRLPPLRFHAPRGPPVLA